MRRLVAGTSLLMLAVATVIAAGDPTAEIKAADQGWSKACQAHNLDQFLTFVADDISMAGPDGKWTHGKAAVHDAWASMLADANFKLAWTLESAEVSKDGHLGYTRGSYTSSMGGKPGGGSYTTVWQKGKDGKWCAIVDIAAGQ